SISRTEILSQGHFLWLELGVPDQLFVIPIIAAILTWYNTRLTTIGTPNSNPSMAMMQWTMPVMILFMGVTLPSAISLYWVASTGFTILQTLVMNNPFNKRDAREDQIRKEKELERRLEKAKRNPNGKKKKQEVLVLKTERLEATSVDAAIAKGLQQRRMAREDVEVQVIQEAKKGFLGLGAKDAIVAIHYTEREV